MHQRGGLERLARSLARQLLAGQPAQLAVDVLQQLLGGRRVAVADLREDPRDVAHGRTIPERLAAPFARQGVDGRDETSRSPSRGLVDPEAANPADWVAVARALFVAGDNWCDGVPPPPSIWLGAPNDAQIARDADGNALVTHVGGLPYGGTGYRLPAVAVGENRYIPFAPVYNDGSWLGWLRALSGSHVDLTGTFQSHAAHVAEITLHAALLQGLGYLLQEDADAIIRQATLSGIGN